MKKMPFYGHHSWEQPTGLMNPLLQEKVSSTHLEQTQTKLRRMNPRFQFNCFKENSSFIVYFQKKYFLHFFYVDNHFFNLKLFLKKLGQKYTEAPKETIQELQLQSDKNFNFQMQEYSQQTGSQGEKRHEQSFATLPILRHYLEGGVCGVPLDAGQRKGLTSISINAQSSINMEGEVTNRQK